jgi:3-dehydroquinate dehydratase-2
LTAKFGILVKRNCIFMAKNILLLNGPNLNLLGSREPEVYGSTTLADIEHAAIAQAIAAGASLAAFQSNQEGVLIDRIHAAKTAGVDAIVINPGGLTHTSVALRDALAGVAIPFIEIHISNIHRREAFRHHSYLSDIAVGVICGLGVEGYRLAIDYALKKL